MEPQTLYDVLGGSLVRSGMMFHHSTYDAEALLSQFDNTPSFQPIVNPSVVTSSEQEVLQFLVLDDSSVEDGTTTELNKMMQAWDDDSSSTSSSAENDDEPAEASH